MKYIIAFLLLCALTTELHLKTKYCLIQGKKCSLDMECCDNLVCIKNYETKRRSCEPKLSLGEKCVKNTDCEAPNYCSIFCVAPKESERRCAHDFECKSGNCRSLEGEKYKSCE